MRKRLACIIFLLVNVLAVICAINQDGHYKDSFEISAYKIGADENASEYFALHVVDSIYDSFLNPADSIENQIVIDNKINYLFDDLQNDPQPRTTTFNADTMIFHVIAMGNRLGNYSLTISFSPLKAERTNDIINTAYTMGNARVNFENSEPSITEGNTERNTTYIYANNSTVLPETWGRVKEKWSYIYNPITPSRNFTGRIADNGVLQLDWKILSVLEEYDDAFWRVNPYKYSIYDSSSIQSPLWIARAAVAMSIDKDSYDLSPEDEYRTSVTVTFTQN